MDAVTNFLLWIHIAGGTLGLAFGFFQLVATKGNQRHQQLGKWYFTTLLVSAMSAWVLSLLRPNYFLTWVALLTAFMLVTGKWALHAQQNRKVLVFKWIMTACILLMGAMLVSFGLFEWAMRQNTFGVVILVFGVLSFLFGFQDYVWLRTKRQGQNQKIHLQRMTGSYIAALTAFLVVNNTILPGILAWLLPTLLLTPLIIYWSKRRIG